jgi:hypothetical protein
MQELIVSIIVAQQKKNQMTALTSSHAQQDQVLTK